MNNTYLKYKIKELKVLMVHINIHYIYIYDSLYMYK